MAKITKTILIISHIIRISLILAIGLAVYERQWITLFLSVFTLFLTFFPAILKKNYKITLPLEFEFLIMIFIYGTLFLGEISDYYNKFWWWDILLHTMSGFILGTIGFLIVHTLNKEKNVYVELSPIFITIFSFSFALSIGALWEMFEFTMDSLFNLNMQKSGLVDTMWDLIVDSIGALIISVAGYFYTKKIKTPIMHNFIDKLISNYKKND